MKEKKKPAKPCYQILKEQVPVSQWTEFVEHLITDIQKRNRWSDVNLIAQIYINEQWWDRLLELVMEKPTLEKIETYEQYLSKDCATEVVGLYEREIVSLLENSTGRKYYRKACRFIRRIKKLGEQDRANQLIKKLKATYPNRPVLIEELNAITFY